MIVGGVEIMLGVVNDPQFGLFLMVGLGGIFVEVLKDRKWLMLPATRAEVKEALLGLRGAARLNGAGGEPPIDVEAVIDAALRLSVLALDAGEAIAAIDVNPLIALPHGAVAVDALIVPTQKGIGNQ
jgi:acyl-CoA synthetase (NDP forming)